MSLHLYFHPLASYCWKALAALYENDTPFEPHLVDLGNAEAAAALTKLWPLRKFPVLRDDALGRIVPESTIVIEYLAVHYPGPTRLIPDEPDRALEARLQDRFYDLYVHEPMQKIVLDRLRPEKDRDAFGVAEARARLDTAYAMIEDKMASQPWAAGDAFTIADCAAAPALYYADRVHPLGAARPNGSAYLRRLFERPSVARVFREAQPYFAMFPE